MKSCIFADGFKYLSNMKKRSLWLLVAFLLLGIVSTSAQNKTGMRVEVAESETDNGSYSIFTYRDEDGVLGYYLSLGRTSNFLGADEFLGMNVKNIRETAIWLGSTTDEVLATIEDILDLFDKDVETTAEFQGRAATGGEKLGESNTTQCMVVKKALGGKRLKFSFTSGEHESEAYLTKSTVKELRMNFKMDVKLHPKRHNKK